LTPTDRESRHVICTQQDDRKRLLVLGGYGNSGTMLAGFGNPKIEALPNNDGWFDDYVRRAGHCVFRYTCSRSTTAGAANARTPSSVPKDPAWKSSAIRVTRRIVDIVTMDDLVSMSRCASSLLAYIYGVPPFDAARCRPPTPRRSDCDAAQWNFQYRPYFWRDIWRS